MRGAEGAKCGAGDGAIRWAGARNCCGAGREGAWNWRICLCICGVNSWVEAGGMVIPRDGARNSLDGALVGARNSLGAVTCSRPGATNCPAGAGVGATTILVREFHRSIPSMQFGISSAAANFRRSPVRAGISLGGC